MVVICWSGETQRNIVWWWSLIYQRPTGHCALTFTVPLARDSVEHVQDGILLNRHGILLNTHGTCASLLRQSLVIAPVKGTGYHRQEYKHCDGYPNKWGCFTGHIIARGGSRSGSNGLRSGGTGSNLLTSGDSKRQWQHWTGMIYRYNGQPTVKQYNYVYNALTICCGGSWCDTSYKKKTECAAIIYTCCTNFKLNTLIFHGHKILCILKAHQLPW